MVVATDNDDSVMVVTNNDDSVMVTTDNNGTHSNPTESTHIVVLFTKELPMMTTTLSGHHGDGNNDGGGGDGMRGGNMAPATLPQANHRTK